MRARFLFLLASTTAFQIVPSLPVSASPAGKRCAQPVLVDLPSLPSLPELPEPPEFLKNFLRKDTSLLGSRPRGETGQFKRGFDKYGRLQRADGIQARSAHGQVGYACVRA